MPAEGKSEALVILQTRQNKSAGHRRLNRLAIPDCRFPSRLLPSCDVPARAKHGRLSQRRKVDRPAGAHRRGAPGRSGGPPPDLGRPFAPGLSRRDGDDSQAAVRSGQQCPNGPLPGVPLFIMTHQSPDNVPDADPPYTFITSGIGAAVAQARSAAGDKDVSLMGSAAVQQALHEGLLDEIVLHQIPVLLGSGVRLLNGATADLRCTRVVDAPGVTHLTYEVVH
jgi:dihydrofolate reductase